MKELRALRSARNLVLYLLQTYLLGGFPAKNRYFEFGNGASLGATACGEPLKPRYAAEHTAFRGGLGLVYPTLRRVFTLLLIRRCIYCTLLFREPVHFRFFWLAYLGASSLL